MNATTIFDPTLAQQYSTQNTTEVAGSLIATVTVTATPTSDGSKGKKTDVVAIVGGVVAGVVGLALAIAATILWYKHSKESKRRKATRYYITSPPLTSTPLVGGDKFYVRKLSTFFDLNVIMLK